jgi:hypothetical protein
MLHPFLELFRNPFFCDVGSVPSILALFLHFLNLDIPFCFLYAVENSEQLHFAFDLLATDLLLLPFSLLQLLQQLMVFDLFDGRLRTKVVLFFPYAQS